MALESWAGSARPPRCRSRSIHTCCATPAAPSWRTKALIRDHCSTTSAINIQHTVRYTELSPERFKDFWKD